MAKMKLTDFVAPQYPEDSVFDRVIKNKKLDWFTNLVKWFAIRFAYVLYCLGITENLLDIFMYPVSLLGCILLARAMHGEQLLPLIGVALIFFHVFADFADGPIAKARGTCSELGTLIDELGGYADRLALLAILGIFSGPACTIILNVAAGCVFSLLILPGRNERPRQILPNIVMHIYVSKYSLYSIRFMLGIVPLILAVVIAASWDLVVVARFISLVYIFAAVTWLILCIPGQRNSAASSSTQG